MVRSIANALWKVLEHERFIRAIQSDGRAAIDRGLIDDSFEQLKIHLIRVKVIPFQKLISMNAMNASKIACILLFNGQEQREIGQKLTITRPFPLIPIFPELVSQDTAQSLVGLRLAYQISVFCIRHLSHCLRSNHLRIPPYYPKPIPGRRL